MQKFAYGLNRMRLKSARGSNRAVDHANRGHQLAEAGKINEAIQALRQAVSIDVNYADAHCYLGVLLAERGQPDEAIECYKMAAAIRPDFLQAHYNLGNLLKQQGQLEEALASYQKSLSVDPNFIWAHNNIGNVLNELGRHEEALASHQNVIALDPLFAGAYNNMGNILKVCGRLEEAIENYSKAFAIAPDFFDAYANLAYALQDQGMLNQAVQILQTALARDASNKQISKCLVDLLNYHMPDGNIGGAHAKAQKILQRIKLKPEASGKIGNETVIEIYRRSYNALAASGLVFRDFPSQLYRGENIDQGCLRHMQVFDTFKVIPEACFSCFKVLIEPTNVVELVKLMVVFDNLKLENDNIRKCMVELREDISGTYKGYIYCTELSEAEEISKTLRAIVGEKISEKISVSVKRGCSEFPSVYPQYANIEENARPLMAYKEEWRKHEDYIDKTQTGHKYPRVFDTYNHSGLTLHDALVMRTWVSYAAAIGDPSHLQLSSSRVQKLQVGNRPAFQPVGDGS